MKNRIEDMETMKEEGKEKTPSTIELWRKLAGQAAAPAAEKAPDSVMAVYKDRVTYSFILDGEVASIHFDRGRREIFFKGHNILHLDLSESQKNALMQMREVLAADPKAKKLFNDYEATLGRCLADNTNRGEKTQVVRI